MALSSASRALSTKHLKIKFMARTEMSYKFYFHGLHKSWRRDKALPTSSYQAYTQDHNLCVIKTLDQYICSTESWSSGEEPATTDYRLTGRSSTDPHITHHRLTYNCSTESPTTDHRPPTH